MKLYLQVLKRLRAKSCKINFKKQQQWSIAMITSYSSPCRISSCKALDQDLWKVSVWFNYYSPDSKIKCCQLTFLQTSDAFAFVCVMSYWNFNKTCHIMFTLHVCEPDETQESFYESVVYSDHHCKCLFCQLCICRSIQHCDLFRLESGAEHI